MFLEADYDGRAPHDAPLRREMVQLGKMLGDTIEEIAGKEAAQTIETISRLAQDRRKGDREAGRRLEQTLSSLMRASSASWFEPSACFWTS